VNLIYYLNICGSYIYFDSDSRYIKILCVMRLNGCEFVIIFDRIKAMTYAAMAYLYKTNGKITNINNKDTYTIKNPLE
ncbi:UDP-N-acetylglucosamine 1-carboxyvinyltransferase, partial [Francisella tularensis subsp. holarctica]|nr:UDP-N-acetylglucosamine 1-carboxyvinyltransferase [Francisella tularensis subsp. holarctica]